MPIRYKHTIHSPLESPYGGASMVVESDSQTPPTAEQKQSIFEQVHGTGVDVAGMTLTKQDVPDALGMGAGIGAAFTPSRASLLKRFPGISAIVGAAGAAGEIGKQFSTPSEVTAGDVTYTIRNIQEPAFLGAGQVNYDPTSFLSRYLKMPIVRGAEQAGMEMLGTALFQKPMEMAGRGLQNLAMRGPTPAFPGLQAETGGGIIQESLEHGTKHGFGSGIGPLSGRAGWRQGVPSDPRVAQTAENLAKGLGRETGGIKTGRLLEAITNSVNEVNEIVRPYAVRALERVDPRSFLDDILSATTSSRTRDSVGDYVLRMDDYAGINNVAKEAANEGIEGFGRLLDRYVTTAGKEVPYDSEAVLTNIFGHPVYIGKSVSLTDAGEITLGQAISDKRFLEEGILDTIYKKIASGEGGKLGRAEVLAKALRDALEMRIQGTLAREGGDIAVKRYNQQNLETQTINRLAKLVAQSPTQPFSRDSAYMTLGGLAGATGGSMVGQPGLTVPSLGLAALGGATVSPQATSAVARQLYRGSRHLPVGQTGVRVADMASDTPDAYGLSGDEPRDVSRRRRRQQNLVSSGSVLNEGYTPPVRTRRRGDPSRNRRRNNLMASR